MHAACLPYAGSFITPMAAVAGAVADASWPRWCQGGRLDRAYVNNGGDIAFHLAPGRVACAAAWWRTSRRAGAMEGVGLRAATAHPHRAASPPPGRACKGQGGRSFSFGIADAVTVLARTAAEADAAASVVANAVDLPGHPAMLPPPGRATSTRDSDLGAGW